MKKIAYIFLLLLPTAFIFAQQQDTEAKKILEEVNGKMKKYKSVNTHFTLISISRKGKKNAAKKGTISIKGGRYLIKQGKTEIICDGRKIYTFDGNKTVTVTAVEEGNSSLTPQKILAGNYDKDFSYKLVDKKGKYNAIELKPLDSKKNFSKVFLYIDKTNNMIAKATIVDKGSNQIELIFSDLVTNQAISDTIFLFNKSKYPKDVEILD